MKAGISGIAGAWLRGLILSALLGIAGRLCSQTDTVSGGQVYDNDFRFRRGIYMNFEEFRTNKPSVTAFTLVENDGSGRAGGVLLQYSATDTSGKMQNYTVRECFGFSDKGSFYISQGYEGYYYRLFIMGALTHYISFAGYNTPYYYSPNDPMAYVGSSPDFAEYLLDFSSGRAFRFTYRDFADFLSKNDPDLYAEMMKNRKRRKMLHFYLLKYNERHRVYIRQ